MDTYNFKIYTYIDIRIFAYTGKSGYIYIARETFKIHIVVYRSLNLGKTVQYLKVRDIDKHHERQIIFLHENIRF